MIHSLGEFSYPHSIDSLHQNCIRFLSQIESCHNQEISELILKTCLWKMESIISKCNKANPHHQR